MDDRIKASRKQEKEGARKYGGRVNSRSGAGPLFKGDVRTDDELIEFKTTKAASYRLKLADLVVAWRHAILDSRRMVFGIEFNNRELPLQPGTDPKSYVVMTEHDYLAMKRELENYISLAGKLAEQFSDEEYNRIVEGWV